MVELRREDEVEPNLRFGRILSLTVEDAEELNLRDGRIFSLLIDALSACCNKGFCSSNSEREGASLLVEDARLEVLRGDEVVLVVVLLVGDRFIPS